MRELTLNSYICEKFGIDEEHPSFRPIYAATVRYVSSGYNSIKNYHDALKANHDFSVEWTAADFRLEVASIRRYVMNMRFYVLNLCLAKDTRKALDLYLKYGLTKREAVLAWNVLLKNPAMRSKIASVAAARHKDLDLDIVSLDELKARMKDTENMFSTLERGAKRLAARKLRWVAMSHNLPLTDLSSEIMCQTLTIYYQSLPNRFSYEHQLNYLRRGMGSRVDNMNNMYGADKRKRMVSDGKGGYMMLCASESQMIRNDAETEASYDSFMSKEEAASQSNDLEKAVSLDRMMNVRKGSKLHALYNTVLGRHTVSFSNFLQRKGLIKKEESSIEFLARRGLKQIVKHLANWLRVDEILVTNSLTKLREAF